MIEIIKRIAVVCILVTVVLALSHTPYDDTEIQESLKQISGAQSKTIDRQKVLEKKVTLLNRENARLSSVIKTQAGTILKLEEKIAKYDSLDVIIFNRKTGEILSDKGGKK